MRFQCQYCKAVLDLADCQPGELVACGQCGKAVQAPMSPLSPGALLGDFCIVRELGTGGMGTVFLAHQLSLDRDVALKVLSPNYASDVTFIQDFINEARMAAALNCPNVVQAYAVNTADGVFYFAMEYVDGSTLKTILAKDGAMPAERLLDIALDTASALSYAWQEKRLIHRDIKPDNIMINSSGQTKLADLGLAKKVAPDSVAEGETEVFGTPQYVAPEVLLGQPADPKSDIYSLGATLYQLLAGRFPYYDADVNKIPEMHLFMPLPSLAEAAPKAPKGLVALIEGMMAKRPCHRYQNYEELIADLNRVKKGEMPAHKLEAGAQAPIDIDAQDPLAPLDGAAAVGEAAPQGGAKRSLNLSGGKPKVTFGKKAAASAAESSPDAEGGDADPEQAQEGESEEEGDKEGKGKSKTLLLVAIGVVVLLAAGAGFFLLSGGASSGAAQQDGAAQTAQDGSPAAPAEAIAPLLGKALTEAEAAGKDDGAKLEEISRLLPRLGASGSDRDEFIAKAAPIVEAALDGLRAADVESWREEWKQNVAGAQKRLADEKAEAARKAEEERLAKEEADAKKEKERALKAHQKKYAAVQSKVRTMTTDFANGMDFDGGINLMINIKEDASNSEGEKAWADDWMALLKKAARCHAFLRNSGKKLDGIKIPLVKLVKNRRSEEQWEIDEITMESVKIHITRTTYDSKKDKDVKKTERERINLSSLTVKQLQKIMEQAAQKQLKIAGEDGGDEVELTRELGDELVLSFLVARGNNVKKEMEALGGMDFALAEADKLQGTAYVKAMVEIVTEFCKEQADNQALTLYLDLLSRHGEQLDDEAKETMIKALKDAQQAGAKTKK